MSEQLHPGRDSLSPSLLQRVDELCDRFEDAWIAGQRPRIEDYLNDTPEPERPLLLQELLSLELVYGCRSGETLNAEDYVRRFPEHAEIIRAVFAKAVEGERAFVWVATRSNGCWARAVSGWSTWPTTSS